MEAVLSAGIVLAGIVILLLATSIKIVQEYERGVIFRLGRCVGAKGPGVFFIIPVLDKITKINLQIIAAPVASQAVITKDNVTVDRRRRGLLPGHRPRRLGGADPGLVHRQPAGGPDDAAGHRRAHELDQLLSDRERIDAELQIALDTQTEPWGVKVHRVEIRDVGLPESMQRAMARQAEAERERRAKIIAAEGELQASQKLGEAADVMATSPGALQLRSSRRWWRSRPRRTRRSSSRSRSSCSRRSRPSAGREPGSA